MTRNPTLAEDLTHEAFLQVFRKIQSFRSESAFSTWLYHVAVNVVLMKRRRKSLERNNNRGDTRDQSDTPARKEFGRSDPHLSDVADRVILKDALRRLPRGYKKVFLLHDFLGYEHHKIAKALGLASGTSKSQLHKARMRLAQAYNEQQLDQSCLPSANGRGTLRIAKGSARLPFCVTLVLFRGFYKKPRVHTASAVSSSLCFVLDQVESFSLPSL
jgi:RNA polymerase sigma-70 factor (ECF subfamily)